jgi:NAD+ synthase (glutamine-hydrolysing)
MKIRLAQIEIIPGNPKKNFQNAAIITAEASKDGVELLVFPELLISGYLIGDMWEETTYIEDCMYYGEELAKLSTANMTIMFGNVGFLDSFGTDGRKKKINCACVASNGEVTYVQPKILLPNYREFEEPRHFQPYEKVVQGNIIHGLRPIEVNGVKIGVTICEDGWDRDYPVKPTKILANNGAELIVNLSCSPFTAGKNDARDKTFSAHALDNHIPLLYVNSIGCQNNGKTIFTFDGSSVAYDCYGKTIANAPMFEEAIMDFTFAGTSLVSDTKKFSEEFDIEVGTNPIVEIHRALIYGIRQYMKQSKLSRVVIGSSGGIDSAVAAALYAEAIGKKNLLLVNMPSKYNSETTIGLSKQLAKNIGCLYTTIPIGESVELTQRQINETIVETCDSEFFTGISTLKLSQFDLENVQARDRSSRILSAVASAFGGVFTNNGNKSEITVGYCTLYGDNAGFLATIGDLWKTQVYELGKYLNRNGEVIPEGIFNIIPSAELSAEQSLDAGKGDPIKYWYHDFLFRAWVERWNRATPDDIIQWYFTGTLLKNIGVNAENDDRLKELFPTNKDFIDDLERWWKLFKGMAVAKRVQAPPVLAVTRRAFGFDYRETLNCTYFGRKYEQIKEILLMKDNGI